MIGMETKDYVQELKEIKNQLDAIHCELDKKFNKKLPHVLNDELLDARVSLRIAIDCLRGIRNEDTH